MKIRICGFLLRFPNQEYLVMAKAHQWHGSETQPLECGCRWHVGDAQIGDDAMNEETATEIDIPMLA